MQGAWALLLSRYSGGAERAYLQPREPGVGSEFDVHGDGIEDGRGDGDAVGQRGGADGTGVGDGRIWEHDGDLHRHGGGDCGRSDGDDHGHAERQYTDGHDLPGCASVGQRAILHSHEPGFGYELDVHGDGVEDRRGDGDAVGQRGGADRAGNGDGRGEQHDGDIHGDGGNDRE